MHQLAPTEFDAAVDRFRNAEREYSAACAALRVLLASRMSRTSQAAEELIVALCLQAPPPAGAVRKVDLGVIQKAVADHFGLHPSLMKSAERPNHIAHPRQIAMALARELTQHTLEEIGAAFGGRDHGTVIHACKAVAAHAELEPEYRAELAHIRLNARIALGIPEPASA